MSDLLKDMDSVLSNESKELLNNNEQSASEGDVLANLIATMENINMSFNLMVTELKYLKARMVTLEHNVDYLLSQDPKFMEALKKAQKELGDQEETKK